jgi:peroxiredoxin family protein
MPFGVRRFSKGSSNKTTATAATAQQQTQTPQSLEEARDEAHSHVIEELEQVIEKDKSVRVCACPLWVWVCVYSAATLKAEGRGGGRQADQLCAPFLIWPD